MEFFRQEKFPLEWAAIHIPGDLPNPGIEFVSLASPAMGGRFFTNGITLRLGILICTMEMELKIRMKVKIGTATGSCSHSLAATSWEVLWAVRESSLLSTYDLHIVTRDTSPAPDWITSSSSLINSSCCLQSKTLLRLWDFRLATTWHFWVSAWEPCRLGLRPAVLPDILAITQQPHMNNSE